MDLQIIIDRLKATNKLLDEIFIPKTARDAFWSAIEMFNLAVVQVLVLTTATFYADWARILVSLLLFTSLLTGVLYLLKCYVLFIKEND